MRWNAIWALVMRYTILMKRNVARIFDVFFWPIMDLLLWGFLSLFLSQSGVNVPSIIHFILGALLLWDIFHRSSIGVSASFLEDLWTRNFLNLFASPLTPGEYIAGTIVASLLRVIVSTVVLGVSIAVLFGFNVLTFGLPLALFFANLMIAGWTLGILVVSLILRFGQPAEIMAWGAVGMFQPFAAAFYPVSVLPYFVQVIALAMPPAHVFEGMRALISGQGFLGGEMAVAFVLNVVYLGVAIAVFLWTFRRAKASGRLVRMWQ